MFGSYHGDVPVIDHSQLKESHCREKETFHYEKHMYHTKYETLSMFERATPIEIKNEANENIKCCF